jgi:hypothetical protein
MPEKCLALIERGKRELEGGTPREVRLKTPFEAGPLWFKNSLGILFFVGLFLFFSIPFFASLFGDPALAKVTHKSMRHANHGFWPELRVEYSVGGRPAAGPIRVSGSAFQRTPVGAMVKIHYLYPFTGFPSLDGDHQMDLPVDTFLICAVVFVVLGKKRRKEKYLLTYGTPVMGIIDQPGQKIAGHYSFKGANYPVSMYKNFYMAKDPAAYEVLVVVDPDKPSQYMVYNPELCWWRIVK